MIEAISQYIEKQKFPQREILQQLHHIITTTYPKIPEKMKYGVPYYGTWFYLVALKTHVNLGVTIVKLTKDEIKQFEGSGKTTRHIKIASIQDINEPDIRKKLKLISEKSK